MHIPKTQSLIPRKVAAAHLGLQPQTLAAWAHRGRPSLSYVKLGGRAFYEQRALDKFVEENTRNGGSR